MLTQTGTFSIPVRCTTRKCIVHATTQTAGGSSERKGEDGEGACLEVDFGKVCVGETVQRTIVLRNDGTLPTEFFITSSKHSRPKVYTTIFTTKQTQERKNSSLILCNIHCLSTFLSPLFSLSIYRVASLSVCLKQLQSSFSVSLCYSCWAQRLK